MITGQLKSDIDKLWETFWTGGIANPLTVIEQITYLLFLKRLDEVQLSQEKNANLLGVKVKNPMYKADETPLRWNHFKNKSPEVMFDLFTSGIELERTVDGNSKKVRINAFEFMKNIGDDNSVFTRYMKGATFLIGESRLLDKAVQMLDKINMDDRDTKGDIYEYLLSKIASAGQNGQFRTPRHIIRMMVDMVQPTKEDTICDPSAGSCGFLVSVDDYLRENHSDAFHQKKFREHYTTQMFNGTENDASMVRIGAMNLMLHGIENPNLRKVDALSEDNAHTKDAYSLILANPPFKGSLDYDVVESSILQMVKTKKTELLFLGLMLRQLKVGGRAAVIVPDGILFGSSKAHKKIRQELVENQQLQAIISMPSGVFKPYAGVSTAILFFTRTDSGGTDKVWFYDMKADGYSLDDKRNPKDENNIPDIIKRWQNLDQENNRARTEQSFFVPFEEIKNEDWDLSINRYKEIFYEEIEYDASDVIIRNIKQMDKEREQLFVDLEKMLEI